MNDLPPTPSKFHYIFNLRDLSRIYNGLVLTTPERFSNVNQLIRVWRNEAMRVISDRLIDVEDKIVVNVILFSYFILNLIHFLIFNLYKFRIQ